MSANPRPGADPGPGPGSGPQRQPRGPRRRLSDQDRTGLWRLGCATAAQLPDRHERPGATDAASDPATVGQLHAILEEVCPQLPWPTTGLATRHRHALRQPGLAEALAHADTDPDVIGCCDSLQRVAATVELGFRATVYRLLTCPSTSRHARSLNRALGRLGLDPNPTSPHGDQGPQAWLCPFTAVLVDRGEITPRQLLDTPTDDAEYALLAGAPSWTEAVERLHVGYAALPYLPAGAGCRPAGSHPAALTHRPSLPRRHPAPQPPHGGPMTTKPTPTSRPMAPATKPSPKPGPKIDVEIHAEIGARLDRDPDLIAARTALHAIAARLDPTVRRDLREVR